MESLRVRPKAKELEALRAKLVKECGVCGGTGKILTGAFNGPNALFDDCKCFKKFLALYELIVGGVPSHYLKTIRKDLLPRQVKEIDHETGRPARFSKDLGELFARIIKKHTQFINRGHSLFFTGYNSTGKSYAAIWLMYRFAYRGHTVHYIKFKRLHGTILNSFNDGELRKLLSEIEAVDLLCIDEVGKESSATAQVIGEFEEWLKSRQDSGKSTIIITNLDVSDFRERYEASIWEALAEKFLILAFDTKNNFRRMHRRWEY